MKNNKNNYTVQEHINDAVSTIYSNGGSIIPAGYVPDELRDTIDAKQFYSLQMLLNSTQGDTHGRVAVYMPGFSNVSATLTTLDLTPIKENISWDRVMGTVLTHSRKVHERGGVLVPKTPEDVQNEGEKMLNVMTEPRSKYSENAVDSMQKAIEYSVKSLDASIRNQLIKE